MNNPAPQDDRVITRLHNEPPSDEQIQIAKLEKDNEDVLTIYRLTIAKADEMPTAIDDDETQGVVTDYLQKLKKTRKMLDGARESEKAPHMAKAGVVQNFFKSKMDMIDKVGVALNERAANYAKKKEDEKRRALEEKAQREREEAAEKLRQAQEAEAKAKAAAEAERKAREDAERIAREAKEKAEADAAAARKKAEEEAAAIRKKADDDLREAHERAEKLKREIAEAAAKNEADAKAAKEAIEKAEAEAAAAEKAKKEAEKQAKETVKTAEKEVRAIEKDAKAQIAAAESDAKDARAELREATRDSNAAVDDANRQDRHANRAERATITKGAELSRTRGTTSMSSVSETWKGSIISREALFADAALIWEHIPFGALEQAVDSFVRALAKPVEGQPLKGAIISDETRLNIR